MLRETPYGKSTLELESDWWKKEESESRIWLFVTPWAIVHGIPQARMLEWAAFPFSRGSSQPRDQTQVSRIAGGFFISWATREAHLAIWEEEMGQHKGHKVLELEHSSWHREREEREELRAYMWTRTLSEWASYAHISSSGFTLFSMKLCVCMRAKPFCVWLFVTLWTVAHQAPLSMEFSRQEYWSG